MENATPQTHSHRHSAPDSERGQRPSLTIDYALYEKYLAESDWSESEKREFITTLWSIIVNFVDLGFGVHPLQQVDGQQADEQNGLGACGQEIDLTSLMAGDVISSAKGLSQNQFSKAADRPKPRRQQRRNYACLPG